MTEKKKKSINQTKIRILIMLVIIVLIILVIIFANARAHKKENIMNRVIAGMDNLNYSYTIDYGKTNVQVFGKKEKRTSTDGNIIYIDYENKISTLIYPETNYKEEYSNEGLTDMQYYQKFIEEYFINDLYKYRYIGKKYYNGKDCIVVEFKDKHDVDGRYSIARLWIDDSLNTIEKTEFYIEYKGDEKKVDEIEFNYHSDSNTANDVQIPENVATEYSSNTNN